MKAFVVTFIMLTEFSPDPYDCYTASSPMSLEELGYSSKQAMLVAQEIRKLFSAYGTDVIYGQGHTAPCAAWRSERIQINKETLPRFVNRLHVYEGTRGEHHGRYLGFLSLRPVIHRWHEGYRYTTIAHIIPPRYMLRPRYHLITAAIGAAEGVMPFRGVPFCVPNVDTLNYASCLHAALHQALLLKMNTFACTTIGSQDMLALLWRQYGRTVENMYGHGANLEQGLSILEHPDVRAGGVLESLVYSLQDPDSQLNVLQCMTDYLANGLPLILVHKIPPSAYHQDTRLHSKFIFGMHLLRDPEDQIDSDTDYKSSLQSVESALLPGRFVYHDVLEGPFAECSAEMLLKQASIQDEAGSNVFFLAIAPRGTNMAISAVRETTRLLLNGHPEPSFMQHFTEYRHDLPLLEQCRIVIRLMQTGQVIRRYLMTYNADNNVSTIPDAHNILTAGINDSQEYWWCAEVRPLWPKKSVEVHFPAFVYLWPVQGTPDKTPHAMLRRSGEKTIEFNTKEQTQSYVYAGQFA